MPANYAISGVWFRESRKGSEHISHVMLHDVTSTGVISKGTKVDTVTVIRLLLTKSISTIKWNYKDGVWQWGAKVSTEVRSNTTYIRTIPDGDVTNNLDNIINMDIL